MTGWQDELMKKAKTYYKTLKDQMQQWRLRKLNIVREQLEMARNIMFFPKSNYQNHLKIKYENKIWTKGSVQSLSLERLCWLNWINLSRSECNIFWHLYSFALISVTNSDSTKLFIGENLLIKLYQFQWKWMKKLMVFILFCPNKCN